MRLIQLHLNAIRNTIFYYLFCTISALRLAQHSFVSLHAHAHAHAQAGAHADAEAECHFVW